MNILVTGANGQLGTEIRNLAAGSRNRYIFTDVTSLPGVETVHLDITNPGALKIVCDSEDVDVIVNCAAYTNVDKAEDDHVTAMMLNSTAAGYLAQVCAARGGTLVHISTDYVFHGDIPSHPARRTDRPTRWVSMVRLSFQARRKIAKSGCRQHHIPDRMALLPFRQEFRQDHAHPDSRKGLGESRVRPGRYPDICQGPSYPDRKSHQR